MQTTFNLRKKRSVTDMVSDVFNYLKIHFLPLCKALLVLVSPFFLIGGIFMGLFYSNFFESIFNNNQPDMT
jgi:hypothetical protein